MSGDGWRAMAGLALAWLGYCALHSLLATLAVKRWIALRWPAFNPAYRIVYNGLSVALLLPIAGLIANHRGPSLWAWSGPAAWLANALAVAALIAVVVTFRHYDGSQFVGWRQWAARRTVMPGTLVAGDGVAESLRLSPLHRYVRHPWYSAALVLIWTRDMDAATLVSALVMSVYFVLGARLEEAKLVVEFGAAYRRYRQRVAGLVPLPWKTLSSAEAAAIEAAANACGQSQRPAQPGRSSRV